MTPRARRIASWTALALVLAAAAFLRFCELGRRGFCHPENYVPGLPVPSWVHDPPERTDLPSLARSLLRDAHPPLYYVVMLPWVKAFGYTETSIRVPSVVFGIASVLLLWLVALREAGRGTALLAAALLALHGQQIYWSQTARVYAFAIFLCLLSTWLLWKALETGRRGWRAAWWLAAVAALWTHVYCWPVVLCQILWSSLRAVRAKTAPAMLASQVSALIVSVPVIALAIYLYRPIVSTDPKLEYLELGYLFWSGAIPSDQCCCCGLDGVLDGLPLPRSPHGWSLVLGVVALALGLLWRPVPAVASAATGSADAPSRRTIGALLAGSGAVAAAIVLAALKAFEPGTSKFAKVAALAAAPIVMAAAFPMLHAWIRRAGATQSGPLAWLAGRFVRLSPLLALGPWLLMAAGSLFEAAYLERGTMLYAPFLLLLVATGLTPAAGRTADDDRPIVSRRWLAAPAILVIVWLHVMSGIHACESDHTLRDYRGLGTELNRRLGKDDLILITNEYSDPPLLYYVRRRYDQFVPKDWARAVAAKTSGNVWIVRYEDQQVTPELEAAVKGLKPGGGVAARGARALQFVR